MRVHDIAAREPPVNVAALWLVQGLGEGADKGHHVVVSHVLDLAHAARAGSLRMGANVFHV